MNSKIMKNIFFNLLVLIILSSCNGREKPLSSSPKEEVKVEVVKDDTIWITAVGDVVPGSDFDRIAIPPDSGRTLITDLLPYISSADIAFANFEGVVSGCNCESRECNDRIFCYRFSVPEYSVQRIKDAGFDFLNIACNHIEDFNRTGRVFTLEKLTEMGFHAAGTLEKPCTVFEKDGVKYGFCAFAQFSGCFGMRDTSKILQVLRETVNQTDIMIVSLHGGAEGPDQRRTPKEDEVFLEFNRGNMHATAHLCIDNGADLIIGTGPHVTRAVELYKDKFIMYSLGNFCTYGPFGSHVMVRHAPLMQVAINKKGEFLEAKAIPIKQIDKGMPRYDSTGLAIKHLKELTKLDFPGTAIEIEEDGKIRRK
jgi:poly-gamma-glutamate capsule biosynthesis protein CapA/YwtB (metallophosphatase superfamily)